MTGVAESFGGRVASPGRYPELGTLLARIKEEYSPIDVVLYGSRARDKRQAKATGI